MIKYLLIATLLVGWVVLFIIKPIPLAQTNQQMRDAMGSVSQPADATSRLRQVAGELYFPRVPYWDGQELVLSVALKELDPVEHTASGIVKWHAIDKASPSPQGNEQKVEATVTHVFFGADAPGGDSTSAVVVAQVLAAEGNATAARGDYIYFWLRDGGEAHADAWGIFPYSIEPRVDFFPYDRSPASFGYFDANAAQVIDPWFPLSAEFGDIAIQESLVY